MARMIPFHDNPCSFVFCVHHSSNEGQYIRVQTHVEMDENTSVSVIEDRLHSTFTALFKI